MRKIMSTVFTAVISAVIFIGLALANFSTVAVVAGKESDPSTISGYDLLNSDYKGNDNVAFSRVMVIILIVVASILALIAICQLLQIFVKSLKNLPMDSISKIVSVLAVIVAIVFMIAVFKDAKNLTSIVEAYGIESGVRTTVACGPWIISIVTLIATVLQIVNNKIFKK